MRSQVVGNHPLVIGKKFQLRIRFFEDPESDRDWHYELLFNNNERVKKMEVRVVDIIDITVTFILK